MLRLSHKENKMKLLLMVLKLVFWVLSKIPGKLEYPCKWMLHYLEGSGNPLKVPNHLVRGAFSAIREGSSRWGGGCIYSSTLYEGVGFWNRPTLFYLVGGFSYKVETSLTAKDVYDWHPVKGEDGEDFFFLSPVGRKWLLLPLWKVLSFLLRDDTLFVIRGKECCISNKLWMQLEAYGAKPFVSSIEVPLSREELLFFGTVCEDPQEILKVFPGITREELEILFGSLYQFPSLWEKKRPHKLKEGDRVWDALSNSSLVIRKGEEKLLFFREISLIKEEEFEGVRYYTCIFGKDLERRFFREDEDYSVF